MLQLLISTASRIGAAARAREFLDLCTRAEQVQERVLLALLRRRETSSFGREYGFDSIKSTDDFRDAVPLGDDESHRPHFDRVRGGESSALFGADERIHSFNQEVPITADGLRMSSRTTGFFMAHLIRQHPGILAASTLNLCSGAGSPKLAVPREVLAIEDADARRHALARFALAEDFSFIFGGTKDAILELAREIDEHKQALIHDISDGSFNALIKMRDDQRKLLSQQAHARRNPARARELEAIVARSGRLMPSDYWPQLAAIATVKDASGTNGDSSAAFTEYFAQVPVRHFGFGTSAGLFAIAIEDRGTRSVLSITGNFYEFIPVSASGSAAPATLLAHEVEQGRRYELVVTTPCGHTRYRTGMNVEVVDHYGNAPVIDATAWFREPASD